MWMVICAGTLCLIKMSNLLSQRASGATVEQKAIAAEEKIKSARGTSDELEATVTAIECYLQALRLVNDPADKKRLDQKTRRLLSRAEQLKQEQDGSSASSKPGESSSIEYPASTRTSTTREKIVLLEGSKLNGAIFKPWDKPPPEDEFQLKDGQDFFCDDFKFTLSETQSKHFSGWKRPKEALANISIGSIDQSLPNEVTMTQQQPWDMVQDVAPDCSVVASLSVGAARAEKGHKRVSCATGKHISLLMSRKAFWYHSVAL